MGAASALTRPHPGSSCPELAHDAGSAPSRAPRPLSARFPRPSSAQAERAPDKSVTRLPVVEPEWRRVPGRRLLLRVKVCPFAVASKSRQLTSRSDGSSSF